MSNFALPQPSSVKPYPGTGKGTAKGVRIRFWVCSLLGTPSARRDVCLWPASRVTLSRGTSGASGEGSAAFKRNPTGFRGFGGREPRVAANAATRGYGRVPLQETCAWGVVREGGVGRGSGVSTSQQTLGRSPGLAAQPPNLEYVAFRRCPMRGAAPWVAPAQTPALLVAGEFAAARLMSAGVREHMVSGLNGTACCGVTSYVARRAKHLARA
jgi:hypothetical protein